MVKIVELISFLSKCRDYDTPIVLLDNILTYPRIVRYYILFIICNIDGEEILIFSTGVVSFN